MICYVCGEEIKKGRGYVDVGKRRLMFRHPFHGTCINNLWYRAEKAKAERDRYKDLLNQARALLKKIAPENVVFDMGGDLWTAVADQGAWTPVTASLRHQRGMEEV